MRGISVRICFALFFVLISLSFLPASGLVVPVQAPQAQTSGPKIWLGQNQPIAIQQTGAFATVSGTEAAGPQPLSIGAGDIDGDGVADLVVGYNAGGSGVVSIFRGNLDALAPQSDESLQGVANGQFPAPFKAEALSIPVPITPDFLVLMPDRTLLLVDTKGPKKNKTTGKIGYWAEEDAVVKIKAAAEQFPFFRFVIAWKVGDDWQHKEIG